MVRNPVDIRIDALVDKWNEVRAGTDIRVVRVLHLPEEEEMVNTFFTFLLSEESNNPDIPIIFEREFKDSLTFTKELTQELYGQILIWNKAELPDGTFNTPINWEPDYSLGQKGNDASLFIQNLKSFADEFGVNENGYIVAILKVHFFSPKGFFSWIQSALDANIDPRLKLVIRDSNDERHYDGIVAKNKGKVVDLIPNFEMDKMMGQIAAMGDPNDPVVNYRKSLMALIEAIPKQDKKKIKEHSDNCIAIALEGTKRDPLWYGQVLVIYSILCNDQIGRKEWNRAIEFASKGVEEMRIAEPAIGEPYISAKLLAQAVMSRAAVYTVAEEWGKAHEDFAEAIDLFEQVSDVLLGIEACRMDGYVLQKSRRISDAGKVLVRGFHLAKNYPISMIPHTSFPGLVEILLETPYEKHLPHIELVDFLKSIYGESWRDSIANWKKPATEVASATIADFFNAQV